VRRSLVLGANPTVRQRQTLLARLDRALRERGAMTDRTPTGELTFRMPPPWRLAPVGWLALLTRGTATLSAWGGGPWRVSYRLYFGALQAAAACITLVIAIVGWGWPRLTLVIVILAFWILGYAPLHLLAANRFRRLLRDVMADVIDQRVRRGADRASAPAASQQPE
jgi:hypothetical protein